MEKRIPETTVSATDAKNNLGALLGRVAEQGETVIVERQGKPRAAIISMEEYRKLRELQMQQRRREAIETIRRLRDEISERNKDMTPGEIEEFADRLSREAIASVIDKRGIRFE